MTSRKKTVGTAGTAERSDVVGGLAPPADVRSGAGDEAGVASSVRLIAERLGLKNVELYRRAPNCYVLNLVVDGVVDTAYVSTEAINLDALLDLHEQARAALLARIALDHDVLMRVRGTHTIRRRRDAEWFAAQRYAAQKLKPKK